MGMNSQTKIHTGGMVTGIAASAAINHGLVRDVGTRPKNRHIATSATEYIGARGREKDLP